MGRRKRLCQTSLEGNTCVSLTVLLCECIMGGFDNNVAHREQIIRNSDSVALRSDVRLDLDLPRITLHLHKNVL